MGVFSSPGTSPLSLLLLSVGVLATAAGIACDSGEEVQSTRLPGVAQDDPFVWPEPGTIVYHSLRSDVWRPIIGDGNWKKNIVDDPNNTPVEDPAVFQEVASSFQEFPLYWLGLEFEGLPLSNVTRVYTEPAENEILLIYGTCDFPPGEGGCRTPLQMRVQPCIHSRRAPKASEDGVFTVRGTIAQRGSDYLLWTGDVFVSISAYPDDREVAAAEALISANDQGPATPDQPLPPPSSDC